MFVCTHELNMPPPLPPPTQPQPQPSFEKSYELPIGFSGELCMKCYIKLCSVMHFITCKLFDVSWYTVIPASVACHGMIPLW